MPAEPILSMRDLSVSFGRGADAVDAVRHLTLEVVEGEWYGLVGESGSGHSVIMDGAPDAGGRNMGFRPMEMLLLGLAGCSAFDVVMILKRGRENVTDCVVEVDADRADTDPKIFTSPWASERKVMTLAPRGREIVEQFCVPSQEMEFNRIVRDPAGGVVR
jgi:uncharacterized OsmC-like protein